MIYRTANFLRAMAGATLAMAALLPTSPAFALDPSAIQLSTSSVNTQRVIGAASEPQNWLAHGRTYDEQRYSPLSQITADNVTGLGLDWYFETNSARGLEATPIVVDGVMFVSGAWNMVYALNARTGELLWQFDPEINRAWTKMACCDVINRGVAVYEGKVVFGTLDQRLIALDAATGKKLWETLTVDQPLDRRFPYTISGAPRVINGKVIIGNGGAEYGVRGYVAAYDINNGQRLWRFFTVPGNPADGFENAWMEAAAKTWNGEWWKHGGGGTVWDSMAYDAELNLLYIGTGNGSPWNREIRSPGGGDNLYLSSIVALNPDTGEYVWHYQETPAENWDYTATQHIMLADMDWKGERRKVIWHAPKNGFFFIIDRTNGKLLSAEPYAKVNWATHYDLTTGRPVETKGANYQKNGPFLQYPSSMGAHNWQPMAHNPATGLVYIPAIESLYSFEDVDRASYKRLDGQWNFGIRDLLESPGAHLFQQAMGKAVTSGHLLAWNPATQKEVWRVQYNQPWSGGLLATAGNLVFGGNASGLFSAYRADNGQKVWETPAQTGVIAPPISYAIDGEQYIAVAARWGGAFGLISGADEQVSNLPGRILVYKLGGDKKLPPLLKLADIPEPPPLMVVSDDVIERGSQLYHRYCIACHGMNGVSNGAVPDLRRLPAPFHEHFNAIVLDGMMAGAGMVGFRDVLNEDDANAIHAWIIQRAHDDKALRESPSWWVEIQRKGYELLAGIVAKLL
jgi:quinohemoprotein ethanol dehydrogenase